MATAGLSSKVTSHGGAGPATVPGSASVDAVIALSPSAAPVLALVLVLGLDAWVYADASSRHAAGRPVTMSVGQLELSTPRAWFIACIVLWILFFPLYLRARQTG